MNCVSRPLQASSKPLREECDRTGRAVDIRRSDDRLFASRSGGAQSLYGVRPDLTTLGKIIGGGHARGGRSADGATSWSGLRRSGPVYQAGTLSGNPVAMVAGLATLELIGVPGIPSAPRGDDRLLDAAA